MTGHALRLVDSLAEAPLFDGTALCAEVGR
jgi:hypothetical protein